MIILKIPKRIEGRDLREFILNHIKKMKRNMKHKYIQLEGKIAYSRDHVFFLFPSRGLELAFALSIFFKCREQGIPCELEMSKPVNLEDLPKEVVEAAAVWKRRKLYRKYYKLRDLRL